MHESQLLRLLFAYKVCVVESFVFALCFTRTCSPATHSSEDWVCGADAVREMPIETGLPYLCYKTVLLLTLVGILPAFRSRWNKYISRKK